MCRYQQVIKGGYISMKDLKRVAKQIGEYIDDDKLEEMIAMGEGDY